MAVDLPILIRSLRRSRGLTQVQFAEQLGITATSVHRYEAGSSNPSPKVLRDLFNLASEDPPLAEQQDLLAKLLKGKMGMSKAKISPEQQGPPQARPFLNVTVLASLTQAEHDILEATLSLIRSSDSDAIRVLQAVLKPWVAEKIPSTESESK